MNFLSQREIWSHVLLRALSLAPDHCSHPQRRDKDLHLLITRGTLGEQGSDTAKCQREIIEK